jgi:hypothetical protein
MLPLSALSLPDLFNLFNKFFSVIDEELLEMRKNRQDIHNSIEKMSEYIGSNSSIVQKMMKGGDISESAITKSLEKKYRTVNNLSKKAIIPKEQKENIKNMSSSLAKSINENFKKERELKNKDSLKEKT